MSWEGSKMVYRLPQRGLSQLWYLVTVRDDIHVLQQTLSTARESLKQSVKLGRPTPPVMYHAYLQQVRPMTEFDQYSP